MRAEIAGGAFAAALAIAGCATDAPLRVVTTTTDLKSLVEAVGRDQVAVEELVPPGGNPRDVELKASQILRLKGADLVVSVGMDEPWLTTARTKAPVLDASQASKVPAGIPYNALAPANVRPITAAIQAELSKLRPEAAPAFESNRRRFLERLDAR